MSSSVATSRGSRASSLFQPVAAPRPAGAVGLHAGDDVDGCFSMVRAECRRTHEHLIPDDIVQDVHARHRW